MPIKIKTNRLPWQIKPKKKVGSFDYNKKAWRNTSIRYRTENPVCEVCESIGISRPVIQKGERVGVTDHIIPIEQGGSKTDERNFMSMCSYRKGSCHDRKRALEAGSGTLTAFRYNTIKEKIPDVRNDIITLLNSKR